MSKQFVTILVIVLASCSSLPKDSESNPEAHTNPGADCWDAPLENIETRATEIDSTSDKAKIEIYLDGKLIGTDVRHCVVGHVSPICDGVNFAYGFTTGGSSLIITDLKTDICHRYLPKRG